MRRWPPLLWLLVYVGSLLILNGSHGDRHPVQLAIGIALAVVACGLAIHLATGRWAGRPRPAGARRVILGVAAFYAVVALAAAIFAGLVFAIAVLLAGVIPMTAVALWVALARSKTVERDGRRRDASAGDHEDPLPGIGFDEASERPHRRRGRAQLGR